MWHGNPQLSRLNFQELWIAYFIDLHQQFQKAPWCWARSSDKKTVLTAHGAEMNRSGSLMMTEGNYEMSWVVSEIVFGVVYLVLNIKTYCFSLG